LLIGAPCCRFNQAVFLKPPLLQVLESVELDFSRYGETLFEVLFAGGRMAAGGNVVSEKENKRLEFTVSFT